MLMDCTWGSRLSLSNAAFTEASKACCVLANQKYHDFAQEGLPGSCLCSGINACDHRGGTEADLMSGGEPWALCPISSRAALGPSSSGPYVPRLWSLPSSLCQPLCFDNHLLSNLMQLMMNLRQRWRARPG